MTTLLRSGDTEYTEKIKRLYGDIERLHAELEAHEATIQRLQVQIDDQAEKIEGYKNVLWRYGEEISRLRTALRQAQGAKVTQKDS